jgi:hypothetical protein
MAEKQFTTQQLIDANPDDLSIEQIQRRTALIVMRNSEVNLELLQEQTQKHLENKAEAARRAKQLRDQCAKDQAENERVKRLCFHKTGGQDKKGFFSGDGQIYGYSISREVLPHGEVYGLCVRCQSEWHSPQWRWGHDDRKSGRRAVLDGDMTLVEYFQQEADYNKMLTLKCKTFETPDGQLPGTHMFGLPALEERMKAEKKEFEEYMAAHSKEVLQARAAVVPYFVN